MHAPYHCPEMSPKIQQHDGGIATDTGLASSATTNRSLDCHAAGECTGGIHGAVRIGANAVMDSFAH